MYRFANLFRTLQENSIINSIAFLLALSNSLYLFFSRLTDKPKLRSKPISRHGNHMIWTVFPDKDYEGPNKDYEGLEMRTYAFIPYMQVYNKGKRPVELDRWTLLIKDKRKRSYMELDILPIPTAIQYLRDGSAIKYEMLGMNDNVGPIQPGSSMSGLSFYAARFVLDSQDDEGIIINKDNSINGLFKIKDIYGKVNKSKIILKYKSYEEVEKIMPGIHKAMYKEN